MTIRHVVLAVGAALVLALAIYLFHEVRSRPAQAQSISPPRSAAAASASNPEAGEHMRPRTAGAALEGAQAPGAIVRKTNPAAGGAAKINDIRVEDAEDLPAGAGSAVKLDAIMLEANKAYDRGDFDEAKSIANKVLSKVPGNVRMLRILVSVACIDNDSAAALASYQQLPAFDQGQMRTRCSRYGIDLK